MSANSFEARDVLVQNNERVAARSDERHGIVGFMALLGSAIPALLIRNLLPDLDPLILAILGVTVYVAYLTVMTSILLRQVEQAQAQAKVAPATVDREQVG